MLKPLGDQPHTVVEHEDAGRVRDLTATDVTALIEEVLEGYGAEMSRIATSSEVPF